MKKTSTIIQEENVYEIDLLINNTAYIKSATGKTGLLNIKTNQIVGDMDYYYTRYNEREKFYYQEKKIDDAENNRTSRKTVRIFDALNEKILVDGWEVIKDFTHYYYYEIVAVKSPIDGKLHLFDKYTCRKPTNIFDMPMDDIEVLFSEYNDTYLVVTVNGKKGLYHNNCLDKTSSLIAPIEFDNIEQLQNIFVYTKNNQKYFAYINEPEKTSITFDKITIDEKNENIAYCEKDNKTYVYNTGAKEMLLATYLDKVKYMYQNGSGYNVFHGEFFFEVVQKGKYGVISSEINNEIIRAGDCAKVSTLLPPKYDEIAVSYDALYLKKDGKIGLFIGDSYHNQVIEPKYDNIDSLGYNYFALYTNGLCDIAKVSPFKTFPPSITNCEIAGRINYNTLPYRKDGKYGFLFTDDGYHKYDIIIPPEYDSISKVTEYYFMLNQKNKKGLIHLGRIMIPVEYDEINIGRHYGKYLAPLYFALRKGEKYELAKLLCDSHYYEGDVKFINNQQFNTIDFFRDVIVLKDQFYSYIYDYNEKLLKTLPASASITAHKRPYESDYDEERNRKYFYCIDGVYYYYKDGNFEEVYTEIINLYSTTYETDKNIFSISSYDKDEHDLFCNTIDSEEDDKAEQDLIEMSRDGVSIRNFPTIVVKREKKKEKGKVKKKVKEKSKRKKK